MSDMLHELLHTPRQRAMRENAEGRCDHEDGWVSRTEEGYTANACWGCLIDAYFAMLPKNDGEDGDSHE